MLSNLYDEDNRLKISTYNGILIENLELVDENRVSCQNIKGVHFSITNQWDSY